MPHVRFDERRGPAPVFVGNAEFLPEEPGAPDQWPHELPVAVPDGGVRAHIRPVVVPLPEPSGLHPERFTQQERGKVLSVQDGAGRSRDSRQRQQRGRPVREMGQIVQEPPARNGAGPPQHHRDPDAALVDPSLAAAQPGVVPLVEGGLALLQHVGRIEERRTVVAGERDDRAVRQAFLVQCLEDPTDSGVHSLDHRVRGGKDPAESALPVRGDPLVAGLERRVRRTVGNIQEERPPPVPRDELGRLLREQVGQVATVGRLDCVVAAQMVPVVVRPSAAESGELVEPAGVGLEAAIERSVVPLPDEARPVARLVKRVGDGHLAKGDPVQTVDFVLGDRSGPVRVATREQRRPCRRADRRGRVVLPEACPLGDEAVEVRGPHGTVSEAPEVSVAHVVGHDENDVWSAGVHTLESHSRKRRLRSGRSV